VLAGSRFSRHLEQPFGGRTIPVLSHDFTYLTPGPRRQFRFPVTNSQDRCRSAAHLDSPVPFATPREPVTHCSVKWYNTGATTSSIGVITLSSRYFIGQIELAFCRKCPPLAGQSEKPVPLGFIGAVFVERIAIALGWWRHGPGMPIVTGLGVGLSPLLQFQVLPPSVLFFATCRWHRKQNRDHPPSNAAGLTSTTAARSSTRSSTWIAAAAPGGCCPTICRPIGASSVREESERKAVRCAALLGAVLPGHMGAVISFCGLVSSSPRVAAT
jgi:hypothetical protein